MRDLRPELNLSVLLRLLAEQKRVNENLHNVAASMLKPGTTVQYQYNARRYFGDVEDVIGMPGTTRVRVKNLSTQKVRDIQLSDITGLVKEE
ncbi:MAG: hypothetical protein KG029_20140 [Bacteroidetes bacterium]|nr:hypothetical protein [Bacteroidota bacterium]